MAVKLDSWGIKRGKPGGPPSRKRGRLDFANLQLPLCTYRLSGPLRTSELHIDPGITQNYGVLL